MLLETYIKELLYRYDCVIVPNFGGFVSNKISAQYHADSQIFHPPSKQLGFNSHLTHNDGLLANYIASSEGISFDQANFKISEIVSEWRATLTKKPLKIEPIGSLSYNSEKQLIFSPYHQFNYLKSSFGLAQVNVAKVERTDRKIVPINSRNRSKRTSVFLKYASAAVVLFGLTYAGWLGYENKQDELNFTIAQKQLEEKIQSATFVIENPLPTVELNVDRELPKRFHVIAGSFQFPENAQKKVTQLQEKGFEAFILGKNKWGLTQVAYASFYKKTDAYQNLASVRKIDSKDAWLLVKQFD